MDLEDILANAKKSTAELQGLLADAHLCALVKTTALYADDFKIGDSAYVRCSLETAHGDALPAGSEVTIEDIRIEKGQTWLTVTHPRDRAHAIPLLASLLISKNPATLANIRKDSPMPRLEI